MTKQVRLAIVRVRTDTSATAVPDPACRSMVMTGTHSVLRYWTDTTGGYLDFEGSAMLPWVDATITAGTTDRGEQAAAALTAVRAAHPGADPLAGFAGVVVLAHPGSGVNAGAVGVGSMPVALLATDGADHTFMAHEVGHVLGFDHTYGLDNNGADWNRADGVDVVEPVYGSPFDLMSSASFGTRSLGTGPRYRAEPTFTGPAVADWPGAFGMGPHLSRANLHRWQPQALAARMIDRPFPTDGSPVRARIVSAGLATKAKCLLILHPAGEPASGVGRVYVEYRTATGWDAGLDPLGPSLSRVGVVVHQLVEVPGVGPRVWYRGCVPTSSIDADVAVASTPLVVTVAGLDPVGAWVDVEVALGAPRGVRVVADLSEQVVGEIGAVARERTPCGDEYRKGRFATTTVGRYSLRTTGFGGSGEPVTPGPSAEWSVGGVPVPRRSGTLNVPHGGGTFALQYTVDPEVFELTLTSRGGERIAVPVVATVAGDGASAHASAGFDADGSYEGIHPDDLAVIAQCLAQRAKVMPIDPKIFTRPSSEPQWGRPEWRRELERAWADHVVSTVRTVPVDAVTGRSFERAVRNQVRDIAR